MVLLVCYSQQQAHATEKRLIVVSSPHVRAAVEYSSILQAKVDNYQIMAITTDEFKRTALSVANDLVICVGSSALEDITKLNSRIPIIAVSISRKAYENILDQSSFLTLSTAIFGDASPHKQLGLIKELVGADARVGVLLGKDNISMITPLSAQAKLQNLDLLIGIVDDVTFPQMAMRNLLAKNVQAIYAVKDLAIYDPRQPNVSKKLLLQAYRAHVPVVGISGAFVRAGAVASIVYRPQDIVSRMLSVMQEYENSGHLPSPAYPDNFGIEVNRSVARSLNFYLRDHSGIVNRISTEIGVLR